MALYYYIRAIRSVLQVIKIFPSTAVYAYIAIDDELRQKMPSAVHVDKTARIQVLDHGDNNLIESVLREFYLRTSCPALINTSLNQRVSKVETMKMLRCFCSTGLAALVMDDVVISRSALPSYPSTNSPIKRTLLLTEYC